MVRAEHAAQVVCLDVGAQGLPQRLERLALERALDSMQHEGDAVLPRAPVGEAPVEAHAARGRVDERVEDGRVEGDEGGGRGVRRGEGEGEVEDGALVVASVEEEDAVPACGSGERAVSGGSSGLHWAKSSLVDAA